MQHPNAWSAPELPVPVALRRFYAAHDIGADGDFDAPYHDAAFGPLRYRVPNGPWRSRALAVHDHHHLATGYRADWVGESEISGWEVGAGLGPPSYGWVIALWGVFVGAILWPRKTFAAYARGRRGRTLYVAPVDAPTVGALRAALGVPDGPVPATVGDVVGFAGWLLVAAVAGALCLVPAALFVGWATAASAWACPCSARAAAA